MSIPYLSEHKLKELIKVTRGASLSGQYFEEEGDLIRLTLGNFDYTNGGFKENTSKENLYYSGPVADNFIMNEEGKFKDIEKWETLKETIDEYTKAGNADANKEIQVVSWRKFKRCIRKAISNDVFGKSLVNEVDLTNEIQNHLRANNVMVIDIARLDGNTQSFVFGSVTRAIYDLKLDGDRSDIPDKIIVFVDELNKYASSDAPKNSPILNQVLDIAERGRSLGIILFSVEQFRSAIHDRVKGNCATQAYGRTNAIEVSKPDYRYIPKVYQNMMTRLSPGEYIISNPALRSLVNVKFPRPAYKQFPNG